MIIECRSRRLVNTDPNVGAITSVILAKNLCGHLGKIWLLTQPLRKLKVSLNAYAVSQRGASARREFRVKSCA